MRKNLANGDKRYDSLRKVVYGAIAVAMHTITLTPPRLSSRQGETGQLTALYRAGEGVWATFESDDTDKASVNQLAITNEFCEAPVTVVGRGEGTTWVRAGSAEAQVVVLPARWLPITVPTGRRLALALRDL